MLRSITGTDAIAELQFRQALVPYARELRKDTPSERIRKKLLGVKAVEQVSRQKLLEGTTKNVLEILGVIEEADPRAVENQAVGYVEPLELSFGDTSHFNFFGLQAPELKAEMLFDTRVNDLSPYLNRRSIDIRVNGTSTVGRQVNERIQFRVFGENDVRVLANSDVVHDHNFTPISGLQRVEPIAEFYDFTARLAEGMLSAKAAGTLAVHGPTDLLAKLQNY